MGNIEQRNSGKNRTTETQVVEVISPKTKPFPGFGTFQSSVHRYKSSEYMVMRAKLWTAKADATLPSDMKQMNLLLTKAKEFNAYSSVQTIYDHFQSGKTTLSEEERVAVSPFVGFFDWMRETYPVLGNIADTYNSLNTDQH